MPEVPIETDIPEPTPASWAVDRQPDEDDLYQLEPVDLRVPVEQQGPVQVQQLGAVDETYRSIVVDDVIGGKLWNGDPRRGRALIIPVDQPIWVGSTQAEAQGTTCAKLPQGAVVPVSSRNRLYARSATSGQTATVTVIMSQWAR